MAKKAKKSMSKAARSARAKASWARRRAVALHGIAPISEATPGIVVGYDLSDGNMHSPGYEALAHELQEAFAQSAHGKGKERHANGKPFDRQPIMELTRLYGPGFSAGQAAKKVQEALQFRLKAGDTEAAHAEVLGGIVYLAAVAAHIRELGLVSPPKAAKK